MVYPGVVNASVHLDPGDVSCSSAGGTNCTVTITSEGVYNVSLTLTNDVGPAQPELDMFDCECILCMYIINPWRTCAARVTVLGLCVCVCLSVPTIQPQCTTGRPKSNTSGLSATWAWFLKRQFFFQKLWHDTEVKRPIANETQLNLTSSCLFHVL